MGDELFNLEIVITKIKNLICDGNPEALNYYLDHYETIGLRVVLEQDLITVLHQTKLEIQQPLCFPESMTQRTSGAVLKFMASQAGGFEIKPSPGLIHLTTLPDKIKIGAAYGWTLRPTCTCLDHPEIRQGWINWLTGAQEAIGPCLLAESLRKDSEQKMIEKLENLFFTKYAVISDLPWQLSNLVKIKARHKLIANILPGCLALFFKDKEAIQSIQQTALALEDFKIANACSETLLNGEVSQADRDMAAALGLAVTLEKATEYRKYWFTHNKPYPWPERLLYDFQISAEKDLEKHLLTNIRITEQTPPWIILSRKACLDHDPQVNLEKWAELFNNEPRDERVLVGLTRAVLSLPSAGDWSKKLIQYWTALAAYSRYQKLAQSFIVLLQPSAEELIDAWYKLFREPSAVNITQSATRAFIRALCRTKRWQELRSFFKKRTFEIPEYEFAFLMSKLEQLPLDAGALKTWLYTWEQVISLPLDDEMIVLTLEQMVNLRQELIRQYDIAENYFFKDVILQIIQCGKAAAEKKIAYVRLSGNIKQDLKIRLSSAGLEGLLKIMIELKGM